MPGKDDPPEFSAETQAAEEHDRTSRREFLEKNMGEAMFSMKAMEALLRVLAQHEITLRHEIGGDPNHAYGVGLPLRGNAVIFLTGIDLASAIIAADDYVQKARVKR